MNIEEIDKLFVENNLVYMTYNKKNTKLFSSFFKPYEIYIKYVISYDKDKHIFLIYLVDSPSIKRLNNCKTIYELRNNLLTPLNVLYKIIVNDSISIYRTNGSDIFPLSARVFNFEDRIYYEEYSKNHSIPYDLDKIIKVIYEIIDNDDFGIYEIGYFTAYANKIKDIIND